MPVSFEKQDVRDSEYFALVNGIYYELSFNYDEVTIIADLEATPGAKALGYPVCVETSREMMKAVGIELKKTKGVRIGKVSTTSLDDQYPDSYLTVTFPLSYVEREEEMLATMEKAFNGAVSRIGAYHNAVGRVRAKRLETELEKHGVTFPAGADKVEICRDIIKKLEQLLIERSPGTDLRHGRWGQGRR